MKSIFSNMPKNWVVKNLPDAFFFQEGPGVRKWQFREKGIKLLNGSNINNGTLDLANTKIHLDETEANGKYKHFLVNEGDLVIASSGVVVDNFHNKIAFVKKEHLPLCMNTSTIRFKSLNLAIASLEFLKFFLKTNLFKLQISRLITGSAQLNFGPSHLEKIQIPLPPLNNQIRIATVLTRAEKLIAKRKESIRELDEFLKSTFLEMFGDPVRNEKGWEVKELGNLGYEFKYGTNTISDDKDSDDKIPILRIPNIVGEKINHVDLKYSIIDEKEKEKIRLKKGDLLFVRTNGNPAYIGRCAVFCDSIECGYASYLIRVRLKDNSLVSANFIRDVISFPTYRHLVVAKAKTTAGNYNINTESLKSLKIYQPPPLLQSQFAAIVERVESLKSKYTQSLTELENLYGSLSQRAFKGKLDLSRVPERMGNDGVGGQNI